jgi:uncharacterized membrane protein
MHGSLERAMAMKLHEIHPSIVHFPLALLPASLALDTIGQLTGSRGVMNVARALAIGASAAGAVAGVAGLVAQQTVRAEGEAHKALVTHRNLNIGLLALTTTLASVRMSRERPGLLYLMAGFAGVAAMNYTAYLGGKMVYTHGVGVERLGGVREGQSMEIRRGSYGLAARTALTHIGRGIVQIFRELLRGEVAPLLSRQPRGDDAGLHPAAARTHH